MIMQYFPDIMKDTNLKEMIYDMHESSVRLIDIVNDFLDVSRIEQGKIVFSYEPVNLQELIEKVMYEMKVVMQEKHLYLKFDSMTLGSLPPVWADKNRAKQVIYNLVGNSLKFTDQGGINIEAKLEKQFIKVSVKDTGRGIEAASRKLLFHKFQQAISDPLTRDTTRGTGLGLYISKRIIENMGGDIYLEQTEVNKGSTFSFTLPIAKPAKIASFNSEHKENVNVGK